MTRSNERLREPIDSFCHSNERIDSDYWRRFASALQVLDQMSDEHDLIARLIQTELRRHPSRESSRVGVLLDIGPGFGLLAAKLSIPLSRRIAVEPNPHLASQVAANYDELYRSSWEVAKSRVPTCSVILASQVVYYFRPHERAACIHAMIDALHSGGVLFLAVDTFEDQFGEFLVQWSNALGIPDHLAPPDIVRRILNDRTDIAVTEIVFSARLRADSLSRFSQGISIYFDVHPAICGSLTPEYRTQLEGFFQAGSFTAENREILWTAIKK